MRQTPGSLHPTQPYGLSETLLAVARRWGLVVLIVLGGWLGVTNTSHAQSAPTISVSRTTFSVEPGLFPDAAGLADTYRQGLFSAETEFAALFGIQPETTITISFVGVPDPVLTATLLPVHDVAWVSVDGRQAIVDHAKFAALAPVESANVLRNLASRQFLVASSGGNIPLGLLNGMARYVETPITASQARLGSLVQIRYQAGTLPGIGDVMANRPSDLNAEEMTAVEYAMVAYIADRYGVANLRDFIASLATEPDWTVGFDSVLDQNVGQFMQGWDAYLPQWFTSGWRTNAVAHFDLGPAQTLFDRGAYEAAAAEAQKSQQLFVDLDDQPRLSATESLLAQCAVGLQADNTMRDVEAALNANDYVRADSLLNDAEQFYAKLPENHRPQGLIEAYRELTQTGLDAQTNLNEAEDGAGSLFNIKDARASAVDAGRAYASIGDENGLIAADHLVNEIDSRIRRYVLTFAALTVLVAAWSTIWIWNRWPSQLHWNRAPQEVTT